MSSEEIHTGSLIALEDFETAGKTTRFDFDGDDFTGALIETKEVWPTAFRWAPTVTRSQFFEIPFGIVVARTYLNRAPPTPNGHLRSSMCR